MITNQIKKKNTFSFLSKSKFDRNYHNLASGKMSVFLVPVYLLVLSFLTKTEGNPQINNYGCSYVVKLEPTIKD